MGRLVFVALLVACGNRVAPGEEEAVQTPHERAMLIQGLKADQVRREREILQGQLARDRSPEVRAAAAAALAFTARDQQSIPALAEALLTEQDPGVRVRLIAALGAFSDNAEAIGTLARYWYEHPELSESEVVLSTLAGVSPVVACASLRSLGDDDRVRDALRRCGCR